MTEIDKEMFVRVTEALVSVSSVLEELCSDDPDNVWIDDTVSDAKAKLSAVMEKVKADD